jgi:tetratricopeptide (TPR) repeat protein
MIKYLKMRIKASGMIAVVLLTIWAPGLAAQQEFETGLPPDSVEDSTGCLHNTSLYLTCYERKDYNAALNLWRQVLAQCPASSEDIYIKGETMYEELYRSTGAMAYIDSVVMIVSQRTFYFNNIPSNYLHLSYVLFELAGNDTFYTEQCYNLIKEVADSFPDYIDYTSSVMLMAAAAKSYSMKIIDSDEVASAYSKAIGIVEKQLASNPDDFRYAKASDSINALFESSGAMTCSSIEKLYSNKVESDIRDTVLINKVFAMLTETGCSGSDFFYRIAAKLFAINRSVENAVRLAELNTARKNNDKAIWYFSEAYKLDTSKVIQSDVLTRVAAWELASGKRQEARDHGEQAYRLNKNNGKALLIIAEAYAGSKIGDSFDDHSAHWVAVDYLKSARSIDPSLKGIADEKIRIYSKLFPTREECFYRHIDDEGVIYRVGGWIDEVTIVRFRKE